MEIDIKIVNSISEFKEAEKLVSKMYSWRNYNISETNFNYIHDSTVFNSYYNNELLSTFRLKLDNGNLYSDIQYSDAVSSLRQLDRKICEISNLAVSKVIHSKEYILIQFFIIYLSCLLNNINSIIIEINPRHETYYNKLLGFEVLKSGYCERVGAPGILMHLDLDWINPNEHGLSFHDNQIAEIKSYLSQSSPCNITTSKFILNFK